MASSSGAPRPPFITRVIDGGRGGAPTKLELFAASTRADSAWMREVTALFGPHAAAARLNDQAQGAPGSMLRELYDAYVLARDAYAASLRRSRCPTTFA